jgi:hypothetical protein
MATPNMSLPSDHRPEMHEPLAGLVLIGNVVVRDKSLRTQERPQLLK